MIAVPTLKLVFVTAVVLHFGCSRKSPSVTLPKPAASPAEAVGLLESACRMGNYDQYLAILAKPNRDELARLKAVIQASEEAGEAFQSALDARFGKDRNSFSPPKTDFRSQIHQPQARIEIIAVTAKGDDKADVKVRYSGISGANQPSGGPEATLTAVKEEDGWKISTGPVRLGEPAYALFENDTKRYKQLTAEVKAGKFSSRREAYKAYSEAGKAGQSPPK